MSETIPQPDNQLLKLRLSEITASLAVFGMLTGALVIVGDVLLRWIFNAPIVALNEIMAMIFAVAIAATLPAGVVKKVNLRVDLLAASTGPKLTAWLAVIGAALLLVFFSALAWKIFWLAMKYADQNRSTPLRFWPIAPFYFAISAIMLLSAFWQLLEVISEFRHAIKIRTTRKTGKLTWVVLAIFVALLVWIAISWAMDARGFTGAAMGNTALTVIIAFVIMWLALLLQFPLAAVMALVGIGGTALFIGWSTAANVFAEQALEFLSNSQVATLPLFLIMGSFATIAGISDDIFRVASAVLGSIRGGLAYATVAGCAGFGAVTGSSVATAATFGRIALPEMNNRGYSRELSAGSVAAGGTLGALVPPSGAIILFALLTEQSIGRLFIAAMIPALLALFLYFVSIYVQVRLDPTKVPDPQPRQRGELLAALKKALPVIALFTVVIGGLYAGIFTVTESAAVGAVGAFILAMARGRINRHTLMNVMSDTTSTTALIYGLIFGALAFSFFVGIGQAAEHVTYWIGSLDAEPMIILIALLVFYLLLGSIMDSYAVMVITVPVVTPLILDLGYDMMFWGVLMLVVVETGMITPPFGLNLFVIKNMQKDLPLARILKGVFPFILADVVKLVLLVAFPALALWLPSTMN